MPELAVQSLPLVQRLALSYAPRRVSAHILTLLALDNRLAGILRSNGEALIAQIKLAWWRDRLGEDPAAWPSGEPLLAALAQWPAEPSLLLPLVDGWEHLLADGLRASSLERFAEGRARAWEALAPSGRLDAVRRTAREWALADLALHLDDEAEVELARDMLETGSVSYRSLPREYRSLAVLHGLAHRALLKGVSDPLDGPGAGLVALRIGLIGR